MPQQKRWQTMRLNICQRQNTKRVKDKGRKGGERKFQTGALGYHSRKETRYNSSRVSMWSSIKSFPLGIWKSPKQCCTLFIRPTGRPKTKINNRKGYFISLHFAFVNEAKERGWKINNQEKTSGGKLLAVTSQSRSTSANLHSDSQWCPSEHR